MSLFPLERLVSLAATAGLVAVLGVAGYAGFRLTQAQLAADVYRHRLVELGKDFEQLRGQYNEAVRRTAVTELVVEDGQLSVHVRNAEGLIEVVPTHLDPRQEVYVDYVVVDGRLWIRRVFDDVTPPVNGVVVDPSRGTIDWDAPNVGHGKAVYRRLSEGRWVVTVTGGGALGLTRVEGNAPVELASPPEVRDYEQMERELAERMGDISAGDIMRRLIGW